MAVESKPLFHSEVMRQQVRSFTLRDYDYRPAREVADAAEVAAVRSVIDVDILGHIFEQSITDLESLRESLEPAGRASVPASPNLSGIPTNQGSR